MLDELRRLLEHLETTLDADRQDQIEQRHMRALRWEPIDRPPVVLQYPVPESGPFQPFPHRQALADPEKMLYNELIGGFDTRTCYHHLVGDDLPFTIRANYGTVIIASMYGAKIEVLDDNPPWARPYESTEALRAVFEIDPEDFTRGWCPKLFDTYHFYHEALKDYPNVQRCVKIVLPDLQGPFDNAEMLRGSAIYTDLIEAPDLVRRLLARMARTQVALARRLQPLLRESLPGFSHQHAATIPGHILIRNDTPINISPAMYREHVAPHDEAVLSAMGTGGVHFCGKGEHLVPEILKLPSLTALDLGQPEMNDLDRIYAQLADRRIPMVRARVPEEELLSGRAKQRFPTGVTFMHAVPSLDHARRFMEAYTSQVA